MDGTETQTLEDRIAALEARLAVLEPETVQVTGSVENCGPEPKIQIGPNDNDAPYMQITWPEPGKFNLEVRKRRPRKDKTLGLEATMSEKDMVFQLVNALQRLADDPRLVKLLPLLQLREMTCKVEEWQRMDKLSHGIQEFFGIIYRYWIIRMSDHDVGMQVNVLDPNRFNGELADQWNRFRTAQYAKRTPPKQNPATIHDGLECYFDLMFMSKWERKFSDALGATLRFMGPQTFQGWMADSWQRFHDTLQQHLVDTDRHDVNLAIERFVRQEKTR